MTFRGLDGGRLLFSVAALVCVVGATAGFAAAAISWGTAEAVPGLVSSSVNSVSCASVGNCAAVGDYGDAHGALQPFVESEKGGVWGNAVGVPGIGSLNLGKYAEANAVSCGSVGNCSAGGYYTGLHKSPAFVVNETNGVWSAAKTISVANVTATHFHMATVLSISCPSAGNCSAGGYYQDNTGMQAFVVNERNEVWGKAIEVPGTATLNVSHEAKVNSLSCASAGNCVAGGFYSDNRDHWQAFVASEKNGVWTKAVEAPGTAALKSVQTEVKSVSCASPGNCSAGGYYHPVVHSGVGLYPFVVTEKNGTWGKAIQVPGSALLNLGGLGMVLSVSCRATTVSASNCSAGGWYWDVNDHSQPFVVSETNGVWGKAKALAVANYRDSGVSSVSCASAGNCAVGGDYTDNLGHEQAFVAAQTNGLWGQATEVPGTATLNQTPDIGIPYGATVHSVSCAGAGACLVGGQYRDASDTQHGFVTSP